MSSFYRIYMCECCLVFFFFSSRRRHTRFDCDWSSDVCSSNLASSLVGRLGMGWLADRFPKKYVMLLIYLLVASAIPLLFLVGTPGAIYLFEIGRESCRERV